MAKREQKRLTDVFVRGKRKPGRYADGGNLYLIVTESGARHWEFIYRWQGRLRYMGLGATHTVTLAEAREEAEAARKIVHKGGDPLAAKGQKRADEQLETAKAMTFGECAEALISAKGAAWSAKHRDQWRSTFNTTERNGLKYPPATEEINGLPVASINKPLVLKVVEPLWTTRTVTAVRVLNRIKSVLDWAKVHGYRDGDNPAILKGNLDHALPDKTKLASVKHHQAVPYAEVPALMSKVRATEGTAARALEFCILTATRTAETLGARRAEVDLKAKLWTIPAGRMKGDREHVVPLSDRAIEIIEAIDKTHPQDREFLFSREGRRALADRALIDTLRRLTGGVGATTHGFRSSFRDWAGDVADVPREIAEAALAHVAGGSVEQAYRRGTALERRRRLMSDWASWCASTPAADNVVPLRA
jgi:integrase